MTFQLREGLLTWSAHATMGIPLPKNINLKRLIGMFSRFRKRTKSQRVIEGTMNDDAAVFTLFGELQQELKSHVLSFVADAPFEKDACSKSTLTHTLPYVSMEFYHMSKSEDFWVQALLRRIKAEPVLWLEAIVHLCGDPDPDSIRSLPPQQLIQRAVSILQIKASDLYRRIIDEFIRFRAPVFVMSAPLTIGEPFGLHLFELRYQILVAEAMQNQPASARRGGPIDPSRTPPVFIHAHKLPFRPNTPAVIVRILRCEIYPDGRADVILVPVAPIWLKSIRVRPNSGHLYEATAIRIGKEASERLGHNVF
jgi:hypothetical protein